MARYPNAVWRPLPENTKQARITPRSFIVHSAAVDSANVHGYFARADVKLESHFFVLKNGTVEQFIDTEVRADASGQANPWALSAETEDDGDPDNQPWTPKQVDSMVDLLGWACDTHRIPRQQLPKWDGAGIGWHSQFGAPSPLTNVRGKTCPGRVRIQQLREVVLPAVLRPPVAPRPPITTTTTTFPEDGMQRIDTQIDLDQEGRGYQDLPVNPMSVVSVVFNTQNPATKGYQPAPDWHRLNANGKARIVVEEGLPGGRVDCSVWVA